MNFVRNRYIVLVLSVVAVAAAGCGSSSKSKSTAQAPAPPSAPSTPSAGTTASVPAGVSASTPVTDPAVRSLLIQGEQTRNRGRFTQAQLGKFADCLISKLQAEGVKTLGQLQQHQSEAGSLGRKCASSLT